MSMRAVVQRRQRAGTSLTAVPRTVARLVERQDGVLSRAQLLAAGWSAADVRTAIAARRWQGFGRNVVVLHNGTLSDEQRAWVAVLLPGKPAALAGPTASALSGLTGFESEHIHVVVAHATHIGPPDWVKIHESRRFDRSDIAGGDPPRTTVARSLVDTAAWSHTPRRACAVLCAGVQQRLVTADRLGTQLDRVGAVQHIAIMKAIVGDIGGGGHTLAELALGPLAARAGLPLPRRQAVRTEPNGRVRYLDAEFDLPNGRTMAVEVDGAVHLLPATWWDDLDRQNEVIIGGSPMLRFSSMVVRLDPDRVVDQLRRMRLANS